MHRQFAYSIRTQDPAEYAEKIEALRTSENATACASPAQSEICSRVNEPMAMPFEAAVPEAAVAEAAVAEELDVANQESRCPGA